MGGYGSIYPSYGGYGYGSCNHNYPLNYHSHGSLIGTAIGGLLTGDFSGYYYAPNPVYPSLPMMGGYGMGYGMGLGYGGFGGGYGGGMMGLGYGGYGYGFGSVPYGGFAWGASPNLPSCTGYFNNYRSSYRGGKSLDSAVGGEFFPTSTKPPVTPLSSKALPVVKKTPQLSLFRV